MRLPARKAEHVVFFERNESRRKIEGKRIEERTGEEGREERKKGTSKFQDRPSFSKIGFRETTVRRFINLGKIGVVKILGITSAELGGDRASKKYFYRYRGE